MKRQLETALEKVPEGPEGDELRARSQWDLSRLNDLLKRLSDAVGDKLAALAAFTATKDDVNAELDKIKTNNDKLKQKKTSDDEEPNPQSLTDRLEALKNQKSELDRLKNKVDNVDKSSLDSNSVAEIEALQKRIADVADEIAKNEKDAEKQLRDKLDSERQDAEAKRLLDDLAALMDRARQTLTDASALPTLYESLGKELEDATANASKTIEDIEPSKRDSGNVSQLLGQLPKASTLAEQINKRFAAWLDFVRERDNANVELDNLREPLDRIEEAPLRNLSEALKDLDELKTASAGVPVIKETTAKLQALCEQLDPLETAYADVRFFDVDVEQTERQYDELMTQLNKEADDENNLRDVSDELTGEVMALCAAVENADSVGVDQFKKELIPALAAQLKNRDARDEAAKKNRRHVARAPIPAEQHLQPIVEQLHAAIRDRLKQIAEDERQALLHSLDKQCELLKAAPTDELLKKVEAQLQQVAPKDDDKAHIDELRRQLEDARTEKERNDADKKKSEEQKHALQDALNSLDNSTQATDKFFAEPLGHTTVAELLPSVEAATETLKKDLDNVQTQTDAVPANSTVANDAKKKLTDGQKLLSLLETLLAKLKQKKDDAAKCEQKLDDAEKCVSDAEKNVDNSASPYKALPQPLIVGQKDLKTEKEQRLHQQAIDNAEKVLDEAAKFVAEHLDALENPTESNNKVKALKKRLDDVREHNDTFFQQLEKDVNKEKSIADLNDKIIDTLNQLNSNLSKALDGSPGELLPIQERLNNCSKDIDDLNKAMFEQPLEKSFVRRDPTVKVDKLRHQVDELSKVLTGKKDEAKKRLENLVAAAAVLAELEPLVVQVDNAVRDAEAVEWNPEASLDEITGAIEKLNKANDDIGAMQSCYDKIDSAEPENDSLRASALAKIETADQTVAPLKQALEDRLEKLNNELANLEKISGECKLAERDVNLAVASNASPDEFQAIVDSRLKPLEESLSAQQLSLTPLVVEKRDAVEKSLKDMREQTEKAINDAQEQQDLVDSLNDAINLVQSEVDQLREKYTESPRPLAESLKDSKKLKELLEKLVTVPVADIKIKPEREYLTRLADSVKSSIKELSGPLDTDARKEEDVLKNFNDTLTDLTAVGDAVLAFDPVAPADSAEARATQADVVSDLNEKLRQLKSRAENVHKDVEQPSKNIARNPEISKDNLPERVAQLQDELNKKKGDMAKRHVLDNVTPEVVAASDALQKRIDDVEQVPLGSIEDQEKTLNDLEKMKRQLETALEKVPEGPEGDELRARSQWDLSRLNDLLKRLSDAVGDKLAALAAFTATKDDVNAELDKIKTNNDKLKQKKTSDDEEPNPQSLTDRLEALKNQKSELDRLKNKVDNVDKSSLDSNSVAEIEALQKRIADVADEIAKNEKDAEKQLRDKLDSERQDAEAKRLLDDLAALMDRARQTLTDASALPTLYESLGKELEDATANASKTIEDIEPSKRDSGNVSQLLGQLPKASTVAEQINKRFAAWLDFVRERDLTVNEIDRWNVFIESENSRPLLSLEEAETNLEVIKQSYADFARWKVITTQNLDNMAETIVPMEVPFNDNRFIQVALESSDQEFEKLLDALFTEYRVEEELQHERNLIEEEVSEMEGRCVLLIDDNDIDGLRRLLFELNSVGAHISQLIQDVASGVENRSFVAIGAGIDGEALRSRVDAVEVRVRGITSSLSPSETDAESPVVSPPEGYDVEAAAEILAALYPNEHPRHVLREHGIDDDGLGDTESESQSDFSALEPPKKSDEEALVVDVEGLDDSPSSSNTVGLLSPIPTIQFTTPRSTKHSSVVNALAGVEFCEPLCLFRRCSFYYWEPRASYRTVTTTTVACYLTDLRTHSTQV
ncbi:hypothetical protein L596_007229 [Steinernema carpocapsae]|uniref:KASH domain-containing protein n=1 Tax=Steinernema carpocapsae TaxID=34508 RepID=A0A4U5P8L6_STECR|nr:hypothetical protein L596_007229 [Steinernema carpocapsae]